MQKTARRICITWSQIAILLVIVISVLLRCFSLDRHVYWHDEVFSSLRVSGYTARNVKRQTVGREFGPDELRKYQQPNPDKTFHDVLYGLTEEPHQLPLYFLLARVWSEFFGSSVQAMRALSLLFSFLVLPCIYWLCRELFPLRAAAWLAVTMIAASPFHLIYAQEARSYSLWTLMTVLSSSALLWARRMTLSRDTTYAVETDAPVPDDFPQGRQFDLRQHVYLGAWVLYTASVVVGMYTHLLFLFVLLAHGIYIILLETTRDQKTSSAGAGAPGHVFGSQPELLTTTGIASNNIEPGNLRPEVIPAQMGGHKSSPVYSGNNPSLDPIGGEADTSLAIQITQHETPSATSTRNPAITGPMQSRERVPAGFNISRVLFCCAAAWLTSVLCYLPWLWVLFHDNGKVKANTGWMQVGMSGLHRFEDVIQEITWLFLDVNHVYAYGRGGWQKYLMMAPNFVLASFVVYCVYYTIRRANRGSSIFLVVLILCGFVPLAIADLMWGGQRSAVMRYLIPSWIGAQLAVAYFIASQMTLTAQNKAQRRRRLFWQEVCCLIIAAGLFSGAVRASSQTWWTISLSKNNIEHAAILNRMPNPLIITEIGEVIQIISLSYSLNPKVRFRVVYGPPLTFMPKSSQQTFLYQPSDKLRLWFEKEKRYQVVPVDHPMYPASKHLLWHLRPDGVDNSG